MKCVHCISIFNKKSHDILSHKILLCSVKDNIASFIYILTIVLKYMIIEKILNCSYKRTIVLHLSLY